MYWSRLGCPAHDQRDFDYKKIWSWNYWSCFQRKSRNKNNLGLHWKWLLNKFDFLDGLTVNEGIEVYKKLEELNLGTRSINYRLKDWEYPGKDIVVHTNYILWKLWYTDCTKDLPVKLLEKIDLQMSGNPLSNQSDWINVKCNVQKAKEKQTLLILFWIAGILQGLWSYLWWCN